MKECKKVDQDLHTELECNDYGKFYIDSGHWTSDSFFASREKHRLEIDAEKNAFIDN